MCCQVASAQMLTPPPVSSSITPVEVRSERRSNYLQLGMTFAAAYVDNLYAGTSPTPLSETTFSILPTISFDQTRPIQHFRFTYHPGFTFYTPTSQLNEIDQSASVTYRRRITPHATIRLENEFEDSSTSFGPAFTGAGGIGSGGSLVSPPGVIPPFAQRLTNNSYAQWAWQTGLKSMVGLEGTGSILNYPNPGQSAGLFNSNSRGGAAFYSRLIARDQYLGAKYIYIYSVAEVPNSNVDVQAHTMAGFYTFYLSKDTSISLMGGPERYIEHQAPSFDRSGWTPSVSVRFDRRGESSAYSIGYTQSVAAGGGLAGAYYTKAADATMQWQLTHRMVAGLNGAYADNKAVFPLQFVSTQSGHSITGAVSLKYIVNPHIYLTGEYQRIHESYAQIVSIHNNPDSGRVAMSITWEATRPFGN
jgi:hypothetical protein